MKHSILNRIVFAGFIVSFLCAWAPQAGAATYSSDTGQSRTWNISVDPGTHKFIVNKIIAYRETDWYVNGSYKERDISDFWNGYWDPEYDYTFASGTTKIEAKVYNSSRVLLETHTWNVTVKMPDLIVSALTASKTSYSIGERFHGTATVKNQGSGSAGSSTIRYYLGTASNKTWKPVQDGSIGSLSAGASATDTIDDIWGGNTIPSDVTPGTTYYIWAQADATNSVTESDENNNWKQSPGFTINFPDLIVSALTVSKTSYSIGERFNGTATVKNQGTATAGSSTIRYYLGTASNKTWKSVQDGSIGSLSAGASATDTIDDIWGGNTIPSDVTPGTTYYIWAQADATNSVTESDENNNWRQSPGFTVNFPDLIVSALTVSKTSYSIGERFNGTATVKNQGTATAGSSTIRYYLGTASNRTWKSVQDGSIGSLSAGASATDTIDDIWGGNTIPSDVTPGTTYYVWALADATNSVTESDENNNWRQSPGFTINFPDLIVSALTVSKTSYSIGERFNGTATVKNQGTATAGSSTIRYYLGTASDRTWKSVQDGSIGSLGAGASATDTIDDIWGGNTIPSDVTPGTTYYVWALADATNSVTESDENNNWRQSPGFTINFPDLTVQSVTGTASSYNVGEKINATATIKNQGNASAGASNLKYYFGTASDQTYRYIEDGSVGSLSIGATATDVINWGGWTIPSDIPEGTYYIWVQADSSNNVSESNEDNNWNKSASFTIYWPKPDLVVQSVTGTKSSYNLEEKIYATATIKNQGPGSAESSKIKYYLGTATDKTWKYIQDGDIGPLGASAVENDTIDDIWGGNTIPNDAQSGVTYYIWVQADANGNVSESDESNNWTQSAGFTIAAGNPGPGPDRGNTTAQEYGDALYDKFEPVWTYNYNHAGLLAGIDDGGTIRTFESSDSDEPADPNNTPPEGPQEGRFQESFLNQGADYYGALIPSTYSGTMPFADRKSVVSKAKEVVDGFIYYPAWSVIPPDIPIAIVTKDDGWTAPIDVSEIYALRCDGLVEYSYEFPHGGGQGIRVWRNCAKPDGEWSIAYYPDHHNEEPNNTRDPHLELSPWAQRGAPPATGPDIFGPYQGPPWPDTKMTKVSVITLPTIAFTQLSLTSTYADIEMRATDESGIFKIAGEAYQGGAWTSIVEQKNPERHPTADSYTAKMGVTGQPGTSLDIRARAQDHGGNWSGNYQTTINFPAGTVSVNVTPENASWTISGPSGFEGNGQTYTGDRTGDLTFTNAPIGPYTWEGQPLAGYNTPLAETNLSLSNGGIISLDKTWTPWAGSLQVTIGPQEAVSEGAQWRRVGTGPWFSSSATESNIPIANYEVEFNDIPDWDRPINVPVTIVKDQTATTSGTYIHWTGSLQVTISPPEAVGGGAQWRRVGTEQWFNSGDIESSIPTGDYQVEFNEIPGWDKPANVPVHIGKDRTAIASGTYIRQKGTVVVVVTPNTAPWSFTDGDGQPHNGAGPATINDVPIGDIVLTWLAMVNYDSPVPNPDTKPLTPEVPVTFNGIYTRHTGTVVVKVTPDIASWSFVDGGGQPHNGTGSTTITAVLTGDIELTWSALDYYDSPLPNPDAKPLTRQDTVTFSGIYTPWPKLPAPEIQPTGHIYKPPIPVTITCGEPGAAIRYTTDGSEPTTTSTVCTADGFNLDGPLGSNKTVKAKTFKTGFTPSETSSITYMFREKLAIRGYAKTQAGDPMSSVTILSEWDHSTSTTTEADGSYMLTVDCGWSGKLRAWKKGYYFAPHWREYVDLHDLRWVQNFYASEGQQITGSVSSHWEQLQGVVICSSDKWWWAVTDEKGEYVLTVPTGWSGTVCAYMPGWVFKPGTTTYSNVVDTKENQDYVAVPMASARPGWELYE